ncbi:Zn-dependent exopeptidase [Laetiporus sulphureus 93-53]|uniref:Zn-dependent exopeptidase n=1 Tax=Laetiporus sulphureus 93-53 TaxID=1314785 RepID=A0A165FK03_9APHY|nr:Zn-dependent exopeptidase [Laetiporus sulphureus 93-53]KZT09086.1 Zn-dependent exopeptidase [Laetiporus sulphureus 93-53]
MAKPLSPTIPDPSLSRPFDNVGGPPKLFHTLRQEQNSVLSLAADASHVYSGSPTGDISVWDKHTLKLKTSLRGHTGSVLALEYAPDKEWLFSASGDSTIRIWSTRSLCPLYILNPHGETDAGDLFSLAWSPALRTLYIGCQDTSLQWFTFPVSPFPSSSSFASGSTFLDSPDASGRSTPTRRVHKFFDSYPQYQRRPADLFARNPTCLGCSSGSPPPTPPLTSSSLPSTSGSPSSSTQALQRPLIMLQVPPANVIYSAHYGYIYCMALVPSSREASDDPPFGAEADGEMRDLQLVTGSGDETVKLWQLAPGNPTPILLHTFECCTGAVLAVAVRGETVFAGCQDGHVKVWDLETRTLVRILIVVENVDILSLSLLHSDLYVCSANGEVQRWSSQFDCTASWKAHEGIVLSSIVTSIPSSPSADADLRESDTTACSSPAVFALVTGANDDNIKIWEVEPPKLKLLSPLSLTFDIDLGDASNETMVYALSKLVSIPSVSNSLAHREDCRQAAIWLRKCFTQLGAVSSLLPTGDSTNPLVFATFQGTQTKRKRPRILFYGHYDVIAASHRGWQSDPFTLTGRNGYLYGRGATDNKGPVVAVACAAAELLRRRALDLDLVLLIEGEEEAGSGGFAETVRKNKDAIGPIDAILVSNSTWIAEDTPCITYGLRGVVHCHVEISCKGPDRHSGVDGGATVEPMLDMLKLLGTLIDGQNRVTIPGFYDSVHPITREEEHLYSVLSGITHTPASSLAARWREPSLTVHNVEVSGPRNSTVIPATVKAHVSLRIVPDQDLNTVANALCEHLQWSFEKMHSPNKLKVRIDRTADWWLGNLDDPWFHALEDAVRDEWGQEPLRIREGGSIPSLPYLEKEFSCHALHLPMGQSSDQAHLPNERISLSNLRRGKLVVERFLQNVAKLEPSHPSVGSPENLDGSP